jgi:WD40 repeat protein
VKLEAKKQGPKAKNMVHDQDALPNSTPSRISKTGQRNSFGLSNSISFLMTGPYSLIFLILITFNLQGRADLIVERTPAYDPESISWSSDDERVTTNSRSGELRVWQVSSGSLLQALPSIGRQGFQMASGHDSDLLAYGSGGHAVILDRVSSREIWKSPENTVSAIGPLIGDTIIYSIPDGIVRYDFKTNRQMSLAKLEDGRFCKSILPLAGGGTVAVMSNRETFLFEGDDLKRDGVVVGAGNKQFYSATSAPNGNLIALTTFEGAYVADLGNPPTVFTRVGDMASARSIAFSQDGKWTAILGRSEIRIHKSDGNELMNAIPCKVSVNQMAWSHDSKYLAVASSDHGVIIFDVATGEMIRTFGKPDCFNTMTDGPQCSVSPDGSSIVLQDEGEILRMIDLVKETNVVPAIEGADWASYGDSWGLKMAVDSARDRYKAAGRFKGSLLDDRRALGHQWGGPGSYLFRRRKDAFIYHWEDGELAISLELPVGVGRRIEISNVGRYALISKPEDSSQLNLVRLPEGKSVGEIAPVGGTVLVDSFVERRDGKAVTWITVANQHVSFNTEDGKLEILRDLPRDSRPKALAAGTGEVWIYFGELATATSPGKHTIISAESGETLYAFDDWSSFRDEVWVVPVAVTPDCKHLWFCGAGGRPVLVSLESGQPLLCVHSWNDGGLLIETPESKYSGNEAGVARIRFINDARTASEARHDLVNEATSSDRIRELINPIISPTRR